MTNNTITLTRSEMQQVLDVIERNSVGTPRREASELLRARLAQPEQEPVAWTVRGLITDFSRDFSAYQTKTYTVPLYTSPHSATHSADSAESFCKPEPVTCSVRFPRHAPKHGEDWIIDPAFLLRVYHSIDPDAHYGFIPNMEEIETALLALEVIPSNLYTAPPQREWQGLTGDEISECWGTGNVVAAVEAKLKEKNT